ncbi:MAG: DUF58 domain-containing protein [Lachnospiraceae bacterium]|nr:DUF58 domain-containing protein [Lachnospiraceae bacterium]
MIWLVIGLAVLVGAAEYYSLTKLPGFLSAESRLLSRTAEPGTPFVLQTTLRNLSRVPASMIAVTERIPPQAIPQDPGPEQEAGGTRLSWRTWLMPRQKLVKEIPFVIDSRGCYVFRGNSLFVGDFMGLRGSVRLFDRHEEMVIFPSLQEIPGLEDTLGGYLGEISVRRFILEDPILTAGLGEYTGREPMRAINWKQTARSRQTMVNQYDHTSDPSAVVILNLAYTVRYAVDRDLLERTLSCARGVIEALEQRRIRYSLCTNMLTAGSIGEWLYVPEGLGAAHKSAILEGLGRSTLDTAESLTDLLDRVLRHMDKNSCCILITPDAAQEDIPIAGRMAGGSISPAGGSKEDILSLTKRLEDRSGCPVLVLGVQKGGVSGWS